MPCFSTFNPLIFLSLGVDEETYWEKLKSDKMKKYENKQKKQGKRGQKKVGVTM
jgi:hypothetical protein